MEEEALMCLFLFFLDRPRLRNVRVGICMRDPSYSISIASRYALLSQNNVVDPSHKIVYQQNYEEMFMKVRPYSSCLRRF